jgi:hypothetical protein
MINLNKLKLKDSDFIKSSDWEDLIIENDGVRGENQFMVFESDGSEVIVNFDLCVSGRIYRDSGDYLNPPYTDVEITDIDVDITSLTVDEYEVKLTKEFEANLELEIKKYL